MERNGAVSFPFALIEWARQRGLHNDHGIIMIRNLHVGTTLAALILFFLPWIEIRCSNQIMATQTGVQIILGDGKPAATKSAIALDLERDRDDGRNKDSWGFSPLLGLAFIAVAAAVVLSFAALRSAAIRYGRMVGVLCATALTLIILQMMLGFPVKEAVARSMASDVSPWADEEMAAEIVEGFQIHHLPALYLELLVLGLPALLLANELIDRLKKPGREMVDGR